MPHQLYLHIPFCKRKCFYCDFCSGSADGEAMEAYGEALIREMALAAKTYGTARVTTVFIGGGTPSLMPVPLMNKVLKALRHYFAIEGEAEFTVEANPGTLSEDWLAMGKAHGVNRLSLGVQAAQDPLLCLLGRVHTFAQAAEAVDMARRQGILNFNLDVMYGLPGQSLEDYRETLRQTVDLQPAHISAYSLILEEGTPLWARVAAGEISLPPEELAADMAEWGRLWLEERGYRQYEISNFAKPGFACKHNLGYWRGSWYLGLGVSAASMLPASPGQGGEDGIVNPCYLRHENVSDRLEYQKRLSEGFLPIGEEHPIGREEAMFEAMMLGLRTVDGVNEKDFERRFHASLRGVYGKEISQLVQEGLGCWREGAGHPDAPAGPAFALTPKGLLVQNQVLLRLMHA